MAVMAKSWTDERLEERFDRIDDRFDRLEADCREFRREMNNRFDAMQRLILQMLVTLVVGFAGVIAALATQL